MKFLVGKADAASGVFLVSGDQARLIADAGDDLMGMIQSGAIAPDYDALPGPDVAVAEITPALPVAEPGKIICLGLNYVDHIKEGAMTSPNIRRCLCGRAIP